MKSFSPTLFFLLFFHTCCHGQLTRFIYDTKGNMTKTTLTGNGNTCVPFARAVDAPGNLESANHNAAENREADLQNLEEALFTLYPNPSTGMVRLDFKIAAATDVTVEILNEVGQIVFFESAGWGKQGSHQFDLSHLSPGLYYVKLFTAKGLVHTVKKLVLQS